MVFDDVVATGTSGTIVETVLAVNQTNEVLQAIQIVLACITFVITSAYTIWKWYKKAKADGKITSDEVEQLVDELKNKDNKEDE